MLFGSLFGGDEGITIGNRRKRKLTTRDVIDRLNNFELTTATCTLIRDHLGNEKIESYGQVDVFRLRDEEVFTLENTFCITTPTGMKLKGDVGGHLSSIVSQAEPMVAPPKDDPFDDFEEEEDEAASENESDLDDEASTAGEEDVGEDGESDEGEEDLMPISAGEDPTVESRPNPKPPAFGDAYSDRQDRTDPGAPEQEEILGLGQVIRLRFFFHRVPYEIDCQIVDRFNPSRLKGDIDLTPRFGVGYQVRPLTDVRNRDKRRYIRYTHRMGFGHLRMRNEIQFHVYAHRTNIEIPERGALKPVLTYDDFKTFPFGSPVVDEVKGADKLEDVVEFFMRCMVNIPTERRYVYLSKGYFDPVRRKSSLIGLGPYATVGAQQTTILPKIFIKKPMKGKTVVEKMLAEKARGPRDAHKMRIAEETQDRYSFLTGELKVWQARRRQKRVENYDNDVSQLSFLSSYGSTPEDISPFRVFTMNCELIDVGLENLTLKPLPFDDSRSRDQDDREFVR